VSHTTNTELTSAPRRELVDRTLQRVGELLNAGDLTLPKGYAWQNELRSAWLMLQGMTVQSGQSKGELVLNVVTQASVANALLDMVVQGLSLARKQGYLIPYGGLLTFQRSYFGTITAARRLLGLKHADAQVVYEGDALAFHVDRGRYVIDSHTTSLSNLMVGNIIGVYVVLEFDDASLNRADVMTMDEVKASWGQSKQRGDWSPHAKFPAEMAKRTVVNRALKALVNSAVDDPMLLDAWNRDATVEAELVDAAEDELANALPLPVDVDDEPADVVDQVPVEAAEAPRVAAAPQPVPEGKRYAAVMSQQARHAPERLLPTDDDAEAALAAAQAELPF
jgi:recombination protein RecT